MKQEKESEPHLRFAVLAADTVLFTFKDGELLVRLMDVDRPPYFVNVKGLPGGLLGPKETAEDAARRHLREKAGIDPKHVYLEQLYTFSEVDRDPRGRVVAVAYLALAPWESLSSSECEASKWASVTKTKKLAYDHDTILAIGLERLRSKLLYTNAAQFLLPKTCTLSDIQNVYEAILGKKLDKRNFRKKMLSLGMLKETGKRQEGLKNRPAMLYTFTHKKLVDFSSII